MDGGLGGSAHQIVSVVLKIGIHKMKGKKGGGSGRREREMEGGREGGQGKEGGRRKNIQ